MQDEDDGKTGYDPSPVNPLPVTVVIMFVIFFGVEAVLLLAEQGLIGGPSAIGWRLQLLEQFGFSPQVFDWMVTTRQYPLPEVMRLFTFGFVHQGFLHMAIAVVIFLAMGKLVGEVMGAIVVPVVFLLGGAVGAVVFTLVTSTNEWVFGAYPGAYGLLGVFTFMLWVQARVTGDNQLQAFRLIGVLMAIQWLFGLLFGGGAQWVAELASFVAGFAMSPLLVPGAGRALLQRMRSRR